MLTKLFFTWPVRLVGFTMVPYLLPDKNVLIIQFFMVFILSIFPFKTHLVCMLDTFCNFVLHILFGTSVVGESFFFFGKNTILSETIIHFLSSDSHEIVVGTQ